MFVFCELNANFQSLLHDWSKLGSCCKRKRSKRAEIVCKHLQSSINIKRDDSETDRRRSLTYIMNSSNPRILLCGTADVTGSREEGTPSIEES